ncbi:hypothetical protein KAM354_09610 [Aeromonas caviae]|nr:hypothetical protein KAM354_09610 [Aeromonas caviae]
MARQQGGSRPGACGGPGALVLDGRQPVAGEGGAPELARQLGDPGRGPAAARYPSGGGRWRCGWVPELARQLG